MYDAEFFSVDGGYVMYDDAPDGFRFACALRDDDAIRASTAPSVKLEKHERMRLGLVLLQSVLTIDEQAILRALVSLAEHRIHDPIIL